MLLFHRPARGLQNVQRDARVFSVDRDRCRLVLVPLIQRLYNLHSASIDDHGIEQCLERCDRRIIP